MGRGETSSRPSVTHVVADGIALRWLPPSKREHSGAIWATGITSKGQRFGASELPFGDGDEQAAFLVRFDNEASLKAAAELTADTSPACSVVSEECETCLASCAARARCIERDLDCFDAYLRKAEAGACEKEGFTERVACFDESIQRYREAGDCYTKKCAAACLE